MPALIPSRVTWCVGLFAVCWVKPLRELPRHYLISRACPEKNETEKNVVLPRIPAIIAYVGRSPILMGERIRENRVSD